MIQKSHKKKESGCIRTVSDTRVQGSPDAAEQSWPEASGISVLNRTGSRQACMRA